MSIIYRTAYSCVLPPALCRLWDFARCSFSSAGRRRRAGLPLTSWLPQFQRATPNLQVLPQPAARIHLAHTHDTDRHTLLSKHQCQSRWSFGVIILIFGCPWCPFALISFIPWIFARRVSASDRRTAALTFVSFLETFSPSITPWWDWKVWNFAWLFPKRFQHPLVILLGSTRRHLVDQLPQVTSEHIDVSFCALRFSIQLFYCGAVVSHKGLQAQRKPLSTKPFFCEQQPMSLTWASEIFASRGFSHKTDPGVFVMFCSCCSSRL